MSLRAAEGFVKSGYCFFFQSFFVAFKNETQPEKNITKVENNPVILTVLTAIIPFKRGKRIIK